MNAKNKNSLIDKINILFILSIAFIFYKVAIRKGIKKKLDFLEDKK